jgi:hypothetical protein
MSGRPLAFAAGIGAITIVLTATGTASAIAQGARPLLAFIVNDAANPVPVRAVGSTLTHLGRSASDIVLLRSSPASGCFKKLTHPIPADCYAPPAGRTLIVTDVQWEAWLASGASTTVWITNTAINANVFGGSAVAGSSGYATNDHHFQTGFMFDPSMTTSLGDNGHVLLYGYLAPSE